MNYMKNLILAIVILLFIGCKTTNFVPSLDKPLSKMERLEQDIGFKKNFKTICVKNDLKKRIKGTLINGQFFPVLFKKNKSTGCYYFSVEKANYISNVMINCTNPNIKLLNNEEELDSLSHFDLKMIFIIPRTENESIKISSGDPFFVKNFSVEYNLKGKLLFCLNKKIYWDVDSSGILRKSIMF